MKKVRFAVNNCTPEESERIVNVVNALLERPIAFQSIFARICKDLNAGLLLSQFWYWKDNKAAVQREGWFFKTHKELTEETYLSRFQQTQARKVLKGQRFVDERFNGSPPKLYFKVNTLRVIDAIIEETDALQGARN